MMLMLLGTPSQEFAARARADPLVLPCRARMAVISTILTTCSSLVRRLEGVEVPLLVSHA